MKKIPEMILIGKVLATHGIKGLVKIQSFMQNPKDILDFKTLYNQDLSKEYTIKLKHIKNNTTFIVEINNLSDINEAEKLKGVELYIQKNKLPKPEKNEFYHSDLTGLKVLTDKTKSGKIMRVSDFGAGSMIEVQWDNNENETIPFNNNFIKEVNLKDKYIKIDLPEYL